MHLVLDARCLHGAMGGIGQATWHLIEHLEAHQGSDLVTVLLGADPPKHLPQARAQFFEAKAGMIDERFEQLELPEVLERLQADAYLNMTFSVPAIGGTCAQLAVIHDVVFEEHPEWVEPRLCSYLKRWSRCAAEVADHLITVSDDARRRIQRVYGTPDNRITRIYNGVPYPKSASHDAWADRAVLAERGLRPPSLLYLGSMEPKKGIAELLAAFADPRLDACYETLALAGGTSGPASDLESMIGRHRRKQDLRRLGYVSEDEKAALLRSARVLVYPSHYEGFGLPPLEAMAAGLPCVVSDATSLPEIVGEDALRVDVKDTEAFVRCLQRAAGDESWRRHAIQAGPLRAARFRWDNAAREYWSVCREAVRRRAVMAA